MTLKEALSRARGILEAAGIEDVPLEAELLLRHALRIDRTRLYQELGGELSPDNEKAFDKLIERRLKGEPSAYITGHREFYGLDFYVNGNTLIPRPESELLVETALRIASQHQLKTIADVGTGCGAIAISLARALPEAIVYATDLSAQALEIAEANCKRHGAGNVRLLEGDMLEPLTKPVELIIANLPYVRRADIPPDSFEPRLALDGGSAGTESIARLCRQAKTKLTEGGSLLLEVGQGQSQTITALLAGLFPESEITVTHDLGGIERVVSLKLDSSRQKVAP